jgi:hypothetical protein
MVELDLPMPVRRVRSHAKVQANVGRVALQRGPVVYCLEGVDNGHMPRSFALAPEANVIAEHRPGFLGGVTVLRGAALAVCRGEPAPTTAQFTAIPYYSWDNREAGQMVVWLPENPKLAEPRPQRTVASESKLSASHKNGPDVLEALNDQAEPANSGDQAIPRFTWWDHRGTSEWVQYEFAAPRTVSAAHVYWFDDTGRGSCRVPKTWSLSYRDGDTWKPVTAKGAFDTARDKFNQVAFEPVRASALRLETELQPGYSGGILEWRVRE